jgi:serine/threonine protein kinase
MDRIIANDHFSEKVHNIPHCLSLLLMFGNRLAIAQDAASVTADVLNAIHYLHSIGITHRDLKVSAE